MSGISLSGKAEKVVLELSAADELYGLQLMRMTGLRSGTLYPILRRLERRGLLATRWEVVDPRDEGRPRRKYYRLTEDGVLLADDLRGELEDLLRRIEAPR